MLAETAKVLALQASRAGADIELLTDLVTQLLSATEVQGRYKCPLLMLFLLSFDWHKALVFAHQSCPFLSLSFLSL